MFTHMKNQKSAQNNTHLITRLKLNSGYLLSDTHNQTHTLYLDTSLDIVTLQQPNEIVA